MTREEIMNMPAGREIDDLMATKVLGFRKEISSTMIGYGGKPVYQYCEGILVRYKGVFLPHYSHDIEAAWEVVKNIVGNKGFKLDQFDLSYIHDGENTFAWVCTFDNHGGSLEDMTDADTAPLAICRAALLAVQS